jgi:ADP-heptose:LPS heptosyltransferase
MSSLIKRHAEALRMVVTVILPIIFRTGSRPVIFSKYSGIGDIVCTFPAALELKKRHPRGTFIYNCHAEFACLPRMGGVTSHVTSIKAIGLVGYWYRFLVGGFYEFASDDDRPDRVPTDVYIKDFGRPYGLVLDDAHPRLQNDPAVVERVKGLLDKKGAKQGPLTVIHAGPSWPVREWPRESWAALVRELEQRGVTNVAQLGTSSHLALGAVDSAAIPGVISLVDQLTLEESCALISLGALFIGIDSGLLHLAVAMRIPSVGLWGATSPQLRFSAENRRLFVVSEVDCQGCHHRVPRLHWITGCPYDIKCMKAIRVETVLDACLKGLGTSPKSLQDFD